ncbi:acyltransferase [Odoribacter sp. Z80]|uniref:acyltransferase family protein n=1 Tax=Odoribacter sp. Z80 TaxID=2304575 RepID=UPI00137B6B15|nr:acyltransferase [Odoribacter sp. Z80]NCE72113.1 acyltransferase [Odoribacter sp. Z80]
MASGSVLQKNSSAAYTDSKPHYELLDGLRGVAALLVLWYHVYEGFAFAGGTPVVGGLNHGYLAVDFFFMLSGFVIGYAYDDRWKSHLTLGNFFKRRLIRLHPMVVLGALWGAVCFFLQGSTQWDGTHVSVPTVMIALLCALFLIPVVPGAGWDVRGNSEAFPLNGPAWSLFFEYIGNLLYALFIRRLSTKALTWLVILLGIGLTAFAWLNVSGYGNIGVGWSMYDAGFGSGLLRMLFPFSMGILLSRRFKPGRIKGAFWICSAILWALFLIPHIGSEGKICLNGVYESFCIIVVFPVLVWAGASGHTTDPLSSRICKFLGDISFPLYIIHYPAMYLFYAWLIRQQLFTLADTWPVAVGVCLGNILLAYVYLKVYDEPVRKWLAKKFIVSRKQHGEASHIPRSE